MLRIILFAGLLFSLSAQANPLERSKNDPTVKEPLIPGSNVPLKELNTAPNPTPSENASEKFRGTLMQKKPVKEKEKKGE